MEAGDRARKLAESISGMEVSMQNVSSVYCLPRISIGDGVSYLRSKLVCVNKIEVL